MTVLSVDPWRGETIEVRGTLEFADGAVDGEGDGVGQLEHGAQSSPSGALGVVVAGDAGARLVVMFDRGEGRITIQREGRRGGPPRQGHVLAETSLELPASIDFSVHVQPAGVGGAATVEVRVDRTRLLKTRAPGSGARGDWGVLAEPGVAGVWRGLGASAEVSRR